MRAAFESLQRGKAQEAAVPLETMARRAKAPAGFLYWAGMARLKNGEADRGAALLSETADRFRNSWYGALAAAELSRMPAAVVTSSPKVGTPVTWNSEELPGPFKARLRQLLLAGFSDEAVEELKLAGNTTAALEARSLIEADQGDLRLSLIHI